ncbi:MAG: sulfotransferase [Lysobacteraceae bacterium]|nr:MAG: sulfotransferase [Xanthomonadaceae bacterium]
MSSKQQALWQQGQRYTQLQQWRQAIAAYEAIVDHDRGFVPAWLELSLAKEKLDAYRDARQATIEAARVVGIPPMAGMSVARRLRRFEALPELLDYIERTGLAGQVPAERLIDLASFFASAGLHEKTLGWIEHALKLRPDLAEAHNMHGLTLMFAGRSEAAAEAFERALKIRPTFASVYSVLSRVAKIDAVNNHVDALRKLPAQPGLTVKDESHLAYALHNELHELRDYDGAWQALERACRARRAQQPYDHAQTLAMFATLREIFDAAFCAAGPPKDAMPTNATSAGASSPVPLFIVGLHRSGTTLLERILSGHPDVADAGETYSFSAQLRIAADHGCNVIADQVIVDRARGYDYRAIGAGFLDSMTVRSHGRRFVTEKMNPNFILLGPIAKALPQARLLHMRRNPADTCFSNLRTLFTHEAAYSYDQIEMADYYKAYVELMAHWREVLPGRVFDIDYDAMVSEPETQARRIAEHCGFDFRPDMLQVDRASGMVATASSNQVRQGIMTNRGGIWRAYESHLGPMLDRLAQHGLA